MPDGVEPSPPRTLVGDHQQEAHDVRHDRPDHDRRRAAQAARPPTEGRWLGGVAAGLGRYFDVNPLVYRIAFAALALVGGTGLLLYLAAWLVIPGEDDDESIAVEALRGRRDHPWLLVGVGLLAFGALFALSEAHFWPGTGNVWLAATLVGGALVWWHVSQRADRPRAVRPPPPPSQRTKRRRQPDQATTRVQPPPAAAQAAGEAVALRARPRRAARSRRFVRAARRARHLRRRRRRCARGGRRDRRRRDRVRGDDAAARGRARLPRPAPAGRLRPGRDHAGLRRRRSRGEDRATDDRHRPGHELRARHRRPRARPQRRHSAGGNDVGRRQRRHRQARRHGAGGRRPRDRRPRRSRLDRPPRRARRRRRRGSTLALPGATPDAPVLDLEADIAIGDIQVQRG